MPCWPRSRTGSSTTGSICPLASSRGFSTGVLSAQRNSPQAGDPEAFSAHPLLWILTTVALEERKHCVDSRLLTHGRYCNAPKRAPDPKGSFQRACKQPVTESEQRE